MEQMIYEEIFIISEADRRLKVGQEQEGKKNIDYCGFERNSIKCMFVIR